MKLYVKMLLLVLALMMVLPLMAACNNGKKPNEKDTTDTNDVVEDTEADTNTENPNLAPIAGDREFNILCRVYGTHYTYKYSEIEDTQETDEPVNQAVVERNYFIEEKYSIVIVPDVQNPSSIVPKLQTSVLGSAGSYDIVMPMLGDCMQPAALGLLLEWDKIPFVDQTKSYWMTDIFNTTSLGGYHFFCPGDTNLSAYNTAQVAFFNKKMHKDLGLESIYDLVKADKWTVEKMMEMGAAAGFDVTGEGNGTSDDIYGIISATMIWQPLFYNSGLKIVTKDVNDLPTFSGLKDNSALLYDVIEDICEVTNTHNACAITGAIGVNGAPKFVAEEALMWIECIYGQFEALSMESDYGIVPAPVWNEGDTFYTNIHTNFSSASAVPINAMSYELSGSVMEDMAYYSQQMVIPEYYEKTIRLRGVRDSESFEMLDIIYENPSCDLALVFTGLTLDADIRDLIGSNKHDMIVSTLKGQVENYEYVMGTIVTAFCNEGAKQYGLLPE